MLLLCTYFASSNIRHVKFSATGRQRHQNGWLPNHPQQQAQVPPTIVLKNWGGRQNEETYQWWCLGVYLVRFSQDQC